nr:hypothetical protein P5625_11045 [Bacillus subtilis]
MAIPLISRLTLLQRMILFLRLTGQQLQKSPRISVPDVIISQNGADAHYYDPLTHLSATINIYEEIPRLAHTLAHQYCGGKWIAVGGGGYDIWRVVPRAWARIWLEMKGIDPGHEIPPEWIAKWQKQCPVALPSSWSDPADLYPPIPRKPEITEKNAQTVSKALYAIRSEQQRTK